MGKSIFPPRLQFQSRKEGKRNKIFKQFLFKYFHLISMNWFNALEEFICSVAQLGWSGTEKIRPRDFGSQKSELVLSHF